MLKEFGSRLTIDQDTSPFPHVVVRGVLSGDFHASLCEAFRERLDRGLSPKFTRDRFWKFAHYDACCYSFDTDKDKVFTDFFYSKPWRRFANALFGLKLTPHVLAEFHHHPPASGDGYIHNDYDLSSFTWQPLANGLNPHTHKVRYRGKSPGAIHCARSLALILYLGHADVAGGGTALYASPEPGSRPAVVVPPVGNSLLAFEVSPKSWHGFLSNTRGVRDSLIMWYHSPVDWVTDRYGQEPK